MTFSVFYTTHLVISEAHSTSHTGTDDECELVRSQGRDGGLAPVEEPHRSLRHSILVEGCGSGAAANSARAACEEHAMLNRVTRRESLDHDVACLPDSGEEGESNASMSDEGVGAICETREHTGARD